jgi:hypothetical protein
MNVDGPAPGIEHVLSCQDIEGQPAELIMFNYLGRLVVVGPPGETALLDEEEVEQFVSAFNDLLAERTGETRCR